MGETPDRPHRGGVSKRPRTAVEGRRPGAGDELPPVSRGPRLMRSAEVLAGRNEVMIEHDGQVYRLRCTSKGKLILTK